MLEQAEVKLTVVELRGLEGASASLYFAAFAALAPESVRFHGRNRRPPRDPPSAGLTRPRIAMPGDFLIAYDITCPRRLGRVHRYLAKVAVPIEYSVFFASGEMDQILAILKAVAGLIDKRADDLRCYPLPQRGMKIRLGRATLPQGVYYSDLPAAWMG